MVLYCTVLYCSMLYCSMLYCSEPQTTPSKVLCFTRSSPFIHQLPAQYPSQALELQSKEDSKQILQVCMCACNYVRIYVCMYVIMCACNYICVHVIMCACNCVCVCVCVRVRACMCACVRACVAVWQWFLHYVL